MYTPMKSVSHSLQTNPPCSKKITFPSLTRFFFFRPKEPYCVGRNPTPTLFLASGNTKFCGNFYLLEVPKRKRTTSCNCLTS